MKCKLNDKCEFGDLCQSATRHDSLTVLGCSSFKTKKPMTNEEWMRSATFEELAGKIYAWHTKGYARGKNGLPLNSITEIVEWLKEKHHAE